MNLGNGFFNLIILTSVITLVRISNSLNISSDKMLLVDTQTFEVTKGCREIIIPNNYKKLILQLVSTNIDQILLTDQRINKCNDNSNIQNCCTSNSTFCMQNSNPSRNDFRLNYCIDYTYLYACILDSNQISTYNITANNTSNTTNSTNANVQTNSAVYSSDQQAGTIKITTDVVRGQGCNTAEFIPETDCSSVGINTCKDPVNCYRRCKYVECRKEQSDPSTKVFSMCLPVNLTTADIESRCKNHVSFNDTKPQVYEQVCNKVQDDTSFTKSESSHTFFKFLAVIFGVLVLTTFIASVYYRFKLSIDNTPPFDPPSICPNFIFPRTPNY